MRLTRSGFLSLFETCPDVMPLFGFAKTVQVSEILESKRFRMHSAYLIQMFDSAMTMLGPDSETLTEIMTSLGKKHVRYGVTPEMFPAMGAALISTLETCLRNHGSKVDFNDRVRDSWREVYGSLSGDMISAIKSNVN